MLPQKLQEATEEKQHLQASIMEKATQAEQQTMQARRLLHMTLLQPVQQVIQRLVPRSLLLSQCLHSPCLGKSGTSQ